MIDQDIGGLLRAAGDAMQAGHANVAQRNWERALAIVPGHPVALNGLGMLAQAAERPHDAAALFLEAAESDPGAIVLWLNHARAARAVGDDAGEKASLLRAVAIDPVSLITNVRLAELAERRGDREEAGVRWRAVTALAQNLPAIPADARAAVEHARSYVAEQTAALEQRIDETLQPRRGSLTVAQRRRIDAAIDHMFGKRSIFINQCSGLHVPFLPADEYFDVGLFPWLSSLEAAADTIRAEFIAAGGGRGEGFEPYVQLPAGTPSNVWTALDRSTDWNTLHLWRHGKRDAAACARFPRTAAVLEALPLARLPDRMPTVFFSVLAPRSHIPPHTGVTNSRAIIHLPLIVPAGCRFRVGSEVRAWVEGEALAFDDTIEHEAWNDSGQPRVVLILDTWNPHLTAVERDLIGDFYAASAGGTAASNG